MKKYIILLILCISAQSLVFSQTYSLGDVNHNGNIDIVDALLVAQFYVGLNPANYNAAQADVNASGSATIVDALLIAQFYVGLITQFPGQTTTYTLTISVSGSGSTNPGAGTLTYASGASVPVTAIPASGSSFTGWSGAASGTVNPVTIVMNGNKSLTAGFTTNTTTTGPIGWGRNTTGGAGGPTVYVSDKASLETAAYKDDNPAIIVIQNNLLTGEGMMNVKGNKTIMGAGSGVYLNFGFYVRGSNVIIKNLDIMNGGFNTGDTEGLDGVTWAQDLQNVWVDHCTFHEAMDGLVDPTRNARFVTISYCKFYHQKTAILIGGSDSDSAAQAAQSNSDKSLWHYTVTIHHCWFDDSYERNPRVRYGAVHVFNNYYGNLPNYAIGRGVSANIYSENNYFYNTHEAFADYGSSSQPGYVDDVGSLFEGDNGSTTDYPPPSNWAWKPSTYYSYTPHTAAWVKANLQNYAGMGKSNP